MMMTAHSMRLLRRVHFIFLNRVNLMAVGFIWSLMSYVSRYSYKNRGVFITIPEETILVSLKQWKRIHKKWKEKKRRIKGRQEPAGI